MLCDLDRELQLGRLARHLRPVVKIDDPHARHFAYRRAGAGAVSPRDDLRAADIVRAQRRALMAPREPAVLARPVPARPEPSPDDLVALMAEALVRAVRFDALDLDDALAVETGLITVGFAPLDAGKPEVVGPAVLRARAQLRRRALLDHAADGAAFATLILAWTAGYCLLCPPARAAAVSPVVTDLRLANLFTYGPCAVAVLLVAWLCFAERGQPRVVEEDERLVPARPRFTFRSPAIAPDLVDIEVRRRTTDRG